MIRGLRGHERTEEVPALCLTALLASMAFVWRWTYLPHVGGDSYWYLRIAARFAGFGEDRARRQASEVYCAELRQAFDAGAHVKRCTSAVLGDGFPRYRAIFESRPGYPLLAAPFVKIAGLAAGAAVATAVLFVLLAVVFHIAMRVTGANRAGAVTGAVALCVLPFAYWNSRLMADGAATLGMVTALLGAALILRRPSWPGVLVLTIALGFLFVVKPANAAAVGMTFLACAAGFALVEWRRGDPNLQAWLIVCGVTLAATSTWLAISIALGLPSFEVTLQDLATVHFKKPDVVDPWGYLLDHDRLLLLQVYRSGPLLLEVLIPLAACGFVLSRRRSPNGALWVAVAAAGVVVVAMHPLLDQYLRLISPVWIIVAVAIGLLMDRVVARAMNNSDRRNERPSPYRSAAGRPGRLGRGDRYRAGSGAP